MSTIPPSVSAVVVFETKLQCVSDSSTIDMLCPPIEGAEHAILVGRAVVMQALPQNGCTPDPSDCINSAITNRVHTPFLNDLVPPPPEQLFAPLFTFGWVGAAKSIV